MILCLSITLPCAEVEGTRGSIAPFIMDDFEVEFDFEDELQATDVGQPTEAPQSMPANARKNYRQVRARQTSSVPQCPNPRKKNKLAS